MMAAKRKSQRLARRPVRRRKAAAKQARIYSSVEEILAHRIVSKKPSSRLHDESELLPSVLSSASPSMRKISYRSGIRVGRLVYAIARGRAKPHEWQHKYLGSLVDFFRNSGFAHTTYQAMPHAVVMEIKREQPNLGTNIHVFEAGIISGYLTAASGRPVSVSEERCCANGASACRFVSNPTAQSDEADEGKVLNSFGSHVARNAINIAGRQRHERIAEEYQLLALSHHMHRDVIRSSSYLSLLAGALIGANLFKHYREIPLKGNGEALGAVSKAIELMGLGAPKLAKTGPYRIRVGFSRSNSKREFVEIANSLISGMLSEYPRAAFTSSETIEDGRYQLEFTKT